MGKQATQNLLIVGMGQYGNVAREIALAMNCFEKIDFIDDNHPAAVGTMKDLELLSDQYNCAVVAIGNPEIRQRYLGQLGLHYRVVSLIHPMSCVSPSACIGKGCIIEPMAVVHTEAKIGDGCLISAGAVINHNSQISACCHVDCNATVSARAWVDTYTKIPSGQVY